MDDERPPWREDEAAAAKAAAGRGEEGEEAAEEEAARRSQPSEEVKENPAQTLAGPVRAFTHTCARAHTHTHNIKASTRLSCIVRQPVRNARFAFFTSSLFFF